MSKYLYRKAGLTVTLIALSAALSFSSQAQYRAPVKERATPRAIGVLETYKNGSRRLLPVAFFYQRHFYDASLYRAVPVPFTLYSGTVYEVQQYGKATGIFTVQSASATENLAGTPTWFGNGRFKLADDSEILAKKRPPKIEIDDPTKPTLHRRPGSEGDLATGASTPPITPPEVQDDPDRPKLHKRANPEGDSPAAASAPASQPAAQSGAQPTAQPSQPESSEQDPNRPKLQRTAPGENPTKSGTASGKKTASAPAPTSASATTPATQPAIKLTPTDDPDHPILRRGKPVQLQGGYELPNFKAEEPVSRQIAVSDAGPSQPPQTLIFSCTELERQHLEEQARELARAELRRLASARGLTLPQPPPPAAPKSAKAPSAMAKKSVSTAPKPPELPLTEEQFVPFDLDYSNFATVVYSARYAPASESAPAAGAPAPATPARGRSWVVTVIARQDEGKLVKLYGNVSDPRDLSLYPEVRLIDAVDPEGYGHYNLLFRERKRDGVSWLLGRTTGYEMQTIFETAER